MTGSRTRACLGPRSEVEGQVQEGVSPKVGKAWADYVVARLEANGNVELPLKKLLVEFAMWHGPKNLDQGILKPTPPPIPETSVMPPVEGEC